MIGESIPDRHALACAQLADSVAMFLASGGIIQTCKPAGSLPRPPHHGVEAPPRPESPGRPADSELLEQARTAAQSMTLNEAYVKLGISRTKLHKLAKAGGFQFPRHDKERVRRAQAREARKAEQDALASKIRAYAKTSLTRASVASTLGISNHLLVRLISEYNIDFPRRT